MPQVALTANALQGLKRCHEFLKAEHPAAASRAAEVIGDHLTLLEIQPEIGRQLPEANHLRELIIPFGDAGYVALYHYDQPSESVVVLAFKHQREAGY